MGFTPDVCELVLRKPSSACRCNVSSERRRQARMHCVTQGERNFVFDSLLLTSKWNSAQPVWARPIVVVVVIVLLAPCCRVQLQLATVRTHWSLLLLFVLPAPSLLPPPPPLWLLPSTWLLPPPTTAAIIADRQMKDDILTLFSRVDCRSLYRVLTIPRLNPQVRLDHTQ